MLTILELNVRIAVELDHSSLRSLRLVSQACHEFLQAEVFWQMKVELDFGDAVKEKPKEETYQKQYLFLQSFEKNERMASEFIFDKQYRLDLLITIEKRNGLGRHRVLIDRIPAPTLKWYVEKYKKEELDNPWDNLLDCHRHSFRYDPLPFNDQTDLEIYESIGLPFKSSDLKRAAQISLDLFKWLYPKIEGPLLEHVIWGGNIEAIEWLLEQKVDFPTEAIATAADSADESILFYLFEKGLGRYPEVLYTALYYGKVEAARYLLEHGVEPEPSHIDVVFEGDHYDCIELLLEYKYLPRKQVLCHTAREGRLKHLIWSERNGIGPFDSKIADEACASGHLPILNWLERRGVLPPDDFMLRLHENDFKGDPIELLEWLEDRGIFPYEQNSDEAYLDNRLEVLVWLAERGILPGHELERYYTHPSGCRCCNDDPRINREVGEWVKENRHRELPREKQVRLSKIFRANRAAGRNDLATLKALKREGILPDVNGANEAARYGHLRVVDWLKKEGVRIDQRGHLAASQNGYIIRK